MLLAPVIGSQVIDMQNWNVDTAVCGYTFSNKCLLEELSRLNNICRGMELSTFWIEILHQDCPFSLVAQTAEFLCQIVALDSAASAAAPELDKA